MATFVQTNYPKYNSWIIVGSCTVRNEACAGRCLGLFVLHSVEMKSLFPFVTIINNFWYLLGEERRSSL